MKYKFKIGEVVKILPFKKNNYNCDEGVITVRENFLGVNLYHISNINMPFMSSIYEWFTEDQLEAK